MAGYLKAGVLLLGVAALVSSASAETITVIMNQAKIVKLPRAADTIVIGNPDIADATVQDANTIVLTGKSFGQTNLVVFDADDKVIMDSQISVAPQTANSIRIFSPGDIRTIYCSPDCEGAYRTEAEREADRELSR